MLSKERIVKLVKNVWGNRVFLILLIFNIFSNGVAVVSYPDALSILYILGISALSATIESIICHLFRNMTLRKCVLCLFLTIHMFLAIVDIFMAANFGMLFTGDSIGILAETTPDESQAFLSTYLNVWSILFIVAATCAFIWLAVWLSRKMERKLPVAVASLILSLVGVFVYGQMGYNHVFEGEGGNSVSQLHSITRLGFSVISFRSTYANIKVMRAANDDVTATLRQDDAPSVIVVIGESFSVYHTPLYGYPKQTTPRLSARVNDGSMVLFDDVVSAVDHTGSVLSTVFKLDGANEPGGQNVLFPTCFHKAGYKTALVDNQYFVRDGFSWLTDRTLSEQMYDYRNPEKVGHDINLLSLIPDFDDPQLIIVHLFGQHFTFSDRYPAEFGHFTAADYSSNLTEEEREIVAHYDNATLYNDFVVDSIIRKYEDRNCIVVYFSDHGEEIYEIDDFMGHGNAAKRPTIRYQIRVPFMIWTSDKFSAQYPDVVKRIEESKHTPLITSCLPHFLFEVAGIDTKYFNPELSFINDKFQSKARIVLGSIDYDKYKEAVPVTPRY